MAEDDVDHSLVTLAGSTVQHAQAIVILVQEAGSSGQQDLHHPGMPLLNSTPQRRGTILTLGVNILANLNQELSNLREAGNSSMMESTVSKLISLL